MAKHYFGYGSLVNAGTRQPGEIAVNAVLTGWRERVHGDFATLAIARGESVGRFIGLRPLMPVLQWVGRKP